MRLSEVRVDEIIQRVGQIYTYSSKNFLPFLCIFVDVYLFCFSG